MSNIISSPQFALTIAAVGTIGNFIYTYKTNRALEEKINTLEQRVANLTNELSQWKSLDVAIKQLKKDIDRDIKTETKNNKKWQQKFNNSMDMMVKTTDIILNKIEPDGETLPQYRESPKRKHKPSRSKYSNYSSDSDESNKSDESEIDSSDDSDAETRVIERLSGKPRRDGPSRHDRTRHKR